MASVPPVRTTVYFVARARLASGFSRHVRVLRWLITAGRTTPVDVRSWNVPGAATVLLRVTPFTASLNVTSTLLAGATSTAFPSGRLPPGGGAGPFLRAGG